MKSNSFHAQVYRTSLIVRKMFLDLLKSSRILPNFHSQPMCKSSSNSFRLNDMNGRDLLLKMAHNSWRSTLCDRLWIIDSSLIKTNPQERAPIRSVYQQKKEFPRSLCIAESTGGLSFQFFLRNPLKKVTSFLQRADYCSS